MRAKTKKWFSPLFVLTLAVAGIFGVSAAVVDKQIKESNIAEKANAKAATQAIYFEKTVSWGTVAMHNWGSSGTSWPGTVMTTVSNRTYNSHSILTANLNNVNNTMVIFNNNNNGSQSGDLTIDDGTNFYVGSNSSANNGKWVYWDGTTPINGNRTIYFYDTNDWGGVWTQGKNHSLEGGWPQMTEVGTYDGHKIFSSDYSAIYETFSFHNDWRESNDKTCLQNSKNTAYDDNAGTWKQYVQYNPGTGGSGSTKHTVISSGTNLSTIDSLSFGAPAGKRFKEWNTNIGGTGTSYSETASYSGGSVVLYAIWEDNPSYTVTKYRVLSDTMVATSIGSESVKSGDLPTSPTYSGYRFYKWYSDAECTSEVTSITSATTVYALMYKLGYYLVGNSTFTGSTSTAWNIEGGVLATSTGGDNTASWEGINVPVNSQFRMIYYESDGSFNYQNKDFTGNHVGFSGSPSSGANIVCTSGGTYKVYFTKDYYIAINHDYDVSYYEIKDGSTSSGNTATGNTDILLSTTLDGKFGVYSGYSIQGYYTTSSCDTNVNLGTTYPTGATSVYAYYATDGFYIVGDAAFKSQFGTSGKVFEVCSGVKMNAATGTNYAVYSFTVTATVTLKAYYYSSSGQHWVNHTQKSESATEHGVTFDGSGNYVIPSGTYSLYIFGTEGDESSSLTFGIPLDSYCAEFLSTTGAICTGDTTNKAALLAAFGTLETDFGSMDPVDQAKLTNASAIVGGTDIQEVAARYDFVLRKYSYGTGTGKFHDFMGRNPSSKSAISNFNPFTLSNESDSNDGTTIIIIVASSISILSITALSVLMVKKKKSANK